MSIARLSLSSAWSVWASLLRQQARNEIVSSESICPDALYRRYHASVLAFLCFLAGSPEVAEDLTSLVFEKAVIHLTDVRTPEAAGAWLFRIARNCATDYFRRCKPTVSLEQLVIEEHPRTETLEDGIIANEARGMLLTHLSRLPEREREVIGLKFVAELSNREIASILLIPEGTVGSLLHRTLKRLRTMMKEEEVSHEA
jgi:RNA polymerase sigma-70 factor (ECF subfamily)